MIIEVKLGTRDINNAVKEINEYRRGIIEKTHKLASALGEAGVEVANTSLMSTAGDSAPGKIGLGVDDKGDIVSAIVILSGKDALFIEFGAGIYYNNGNANPYASKLGYGVGTYPSEHPPNRAIHPGYWWYKGEDGNKHFSLGTMASMPLYHVSENARNTAIKTALEIFRS